MEQRGSAPAQNCGAALGFVGAGEVERVMEASAFAAQECGVYDDRGNCAEVAKFQEVGVDLEIPVKLLNLAVQIAETRRGALEPFGCADDADIVPHEAADFIPVVVDNHEFVKVLG